jgi:hypothetical protein
MLLLPYFASTGLQRVDAGQARLFIADARLLYGATSLDVDVWLWYFPKSACSLTVFHKKATNQVAWASFTL